MLSQCVGAPRRTWKPSPGVRAQQPAMPCYPAAHVNAGVARQGRQAAALAGWLVPLQGGRRQGGGSMTAGRKVGRHVRTKSGPACKQPAYTCAAAHVEQTCSQHAVGEQEAGKGKRKGGLHGCGASGLSSGGRGRGAAALVGSGLLCLVGRCASGDGKCRALLGAGI